MFECSGQIKALISVVVKVSAISAEVDSGPLLLVDQSLAQR